jgi:hypothetical protein
MVADLWTTIKGQAAVRCALEEWIERFEIEEVRK